MTPRNRKRLGLILIVLLFAAPITTAYVLNALGWRPSGTRNFGTLLEPPKNLSAAVLTTVDGKPLPLKDAGADWSWTLVGLPSAGCTRECLERLDELARARLTLNQNATHVRVVAVDAALSEDAVKALHPFTIARDPDHVFEFLRPPGEDQVAAALIDPNGFLVLTYAVGYDGNGLRKDLARLFK